MVPPYKKRLQLESFTFLYAVDYFKLLVIAASIGLTLER